MTALREAAQQALEALKPFTVYGRAGSRDIEVGAAIAASDTLRAALAQQDEPTQEPAAVPPIDYGALIAAAYAADKRWAQGTIGCVAFKRGAEWFRLQMLPIHKCPQQAEPDLSRCPQCGGPADNGHDRSIPPSPYLCTKCMAEPCPNCASLEAQNTELDDMLVAMEHAVAKAAAVERKACADICDAHASCEGIAQRCAAAIRARGQA